MEQKVRISRLDHSCFLDQPKNRNARYLSKSFLSRQIPPKTSKSIRIYLISQVCLASASDDTWLDFWRVTVCKKLFYSFLGLAPMLLLSPLPSLSSPSSLSSSSLFSSPLPLSYTLIEKQAKKSGKIFIPSFARLVLADHS